MSEQDKNEDLWELLQSLQVLESDLEACRRQFSDFIAVLEAMQDRCDSLLHQTARAYSLRSGNQYQN